MKVDIYLNFIGKFELPEEETEQQSQEEFKPKKPRTERDREYDRKRYVKIKEALIAAEVVEGAAILEGISFAV